MAKNLSFSIAINLLTENFKKEATAVKNHLRSIQMQILTFAAALGAGGVGLMGLISKMKDVARETSRALTALKNVSGGVGLFADNLRFLNKLAKDYGVEINTLVFNFAKFKAAGDSVGMSLMDQRKIFESVSRAAVAYGMSAADTNLTFLAITQMMSKGKISSEELRRQLGERLPIAMAAMAKAAGVPITKLDDLLKKGKLLSHEVLPKFADALNDMIPSVDTDNIETSLNRLSNTFNKFTEGAGVKEKYKAIIDGLTGLIETASKNIQNIVVTLIAALVFVVTNGITKVWRSYQTVGLQIISSAEAANAKMIAATAARVEAEIALDKAKSAAFFATEKQRLQAMQAVAKAEVTLRQRVAAETKAIEAAKLADARAAAIKAGGFWATTGAMIKGTFLKLGAAIKSMWNTFAPAIIISAIVAVIGYFKNMREEVNRIRNIFSEYKKEASSIGNTQEIKMLQAQLSIMNDKTRSQKEINSAQAELRKMLGLEKGDQRDLNALVAERIKLLKATAQADFYSHKAVSTEDKIKELSKSVGLTEDEAKSIANARTDEWFLDTKYLDKVNDIYKKKGYDSIDGAELDKAIFEIVQNIEVLNDANKELEEALKIANAQKQNTPVTPTDDPKPDKTVDKRLEALRKLDEADRQRQLDKIAFDNEMRQKSIDNMDEGFLKEFAQLKLNHDKELQEIEEFKRKMAKAQIDELKNQYIAKHGNTKGFEASLKTVNLNEVLPEGLKPDDVANQVTALTDAANTAYNTGYEKINKDLTAFRDEERLRFASQLDQQLYDINRHYEERLKLAKGNAELTKQLIENQKKEERAAVLQAIGRQLDSELQYNQKVKELVTDRYVFEADKRRESLAQELADQQKIYNNLDRQVWNDPNNADLVEKWKAAGIQIKLINKELSKTKNEKFREIAQGASEIFSSLRGTLGDFGLNFSDDINKALDGVGQTLDGLASIDITNPVSVITGSIKALGGVAKAVTGLFGGTGQEEYKKNVEVYQRLMATMDKVISKQEELLESMAGSDAVAQAKKSESLINKQIDAARSLGEEFMNTKRKSGGNRERKYTKEIMRPYQDELKKYGVDFMDPYSILRLDPKTLEEIQKEMPKFWASLQPDLSAYLEEIIAYGDAIDDLRLKEKEQLTGVSFDSLSSSLDELAKKAELTFDEIQESFEEHMSNAILNFVKNKILQDKLKAWYEKFAKAMDDDVLTESEASELQAEYERIVREANEAYKNAMNAAGVSLPGDTYSQDSSKGYSTNMDQDTGGAILGRITGLHEVGLRMESMLSGIASSWGSSNIFPQTVSINNELQKQTVLLDEIKQIQTKSFFHTEEMNETLKDAVTKLDKIDKNTKGL